MDARIILKLVLCTTLSIGCHEIPFFTNKINPNDGNSKDNKTCLCRKSIQPGKLTFCNCCDHDITVFQKQGIPLIQLSKHGGSDSFDLNQLGSGRAYYANVETTDAECSALACDSWGDTLKNPPPASYNIGQWTGQYLSRSTFCSPPLSKLQVCQTQNNCCGSNLAHSGWGSLFAISVGKQDFLNFSTNAKCDWVLGNNIGQNQCGYDFNSIQFNVPMRLKVINQTCVLGTKRKLITSLECLDVNCSDAFQYPQDDKQVACPSVGNVNPQRGYLLEYCPANTSLPNIP